MKIANFPCDNVFTGGSAVRCFTSSSMILCDDTRAFALSFMCSSVLAFIHVYVCQFVFSIRAVALHSALFVFHGCCVLPQLLL